jgi:hypothetical protein
MPSTVASTPVPRCDLAGWSPTGQIAIFGPGSGMGSNLLPGKQLILGCEWPRTIPAPHAPTARMGLPFQLRCLGRPQLISPGGETVRFKVRKHLALLTYLALEPRIPHRRDKLADLLWGKVSPAEGRHSLATAASPKGGKAGRQQPSCRMRGKGPKNEARAKKPF